VAGQGERYARDEQIARGGGGPALGCRGGGRGRGGGRPGAAGGDHRDEQRRDGAKGHRPNLPSRRPRAGWALRPLLRLPDVAGTLYPTAPTRLAKPPAKTRRDGETIMPSLENPTHRVDVDGLNFRSEPVVAPRTRRAVLRKGDPVRRRAVAADAAWWEVDAMVGGRVVRGFVAHRYLVTEREHSPPPAARGVRPAMLAENRVSVTRDSRGGAYAYPLGEPARPSRSGSTADERARSLHEIVRWLAVDARARYSPQGSATYCNIYAADYCYLAGTYLPRVWWTGRALQRLAAGEEIAAEYDRTVTEQTANQLHRWLGDHGSDFGWERTTDLDDLQSAANGGGVALITGQRTDLQRPGHITVVVPERGELRAARTRGRVAIPLQSQAGVTCYQFGCRPPAWWAASKYRDFGLWHHA
jgi:hypothetical protein